MTPSPSQATLTAAQVRAARALLGWTSPMLSERARVSFDKALKAQDDEGIRSLSGLDLRAVRSAIETAGIEFGTGGSVRMWEAP